MFFFSAHKEHDGVSESHVRQEIKRPVQVSGRLV